MRKRFLKLLGTGVAASALALTLAACGSGTEESVAADTDMATLDDLKGSKTVTIDFWHSFGDSVAAPLEELIDEFEDDMKAEGYNIAVKVTNKGGGYDGLRSAVNLGADSNSIPDVLVGYPDHFADYIKQDLILSLDTYVNSDDYGLDGVSSTENDFVTSYWNEVQMVVDGESHTVGIPFNKSTEIMCYNSSMVDPILKTLGYGTVDASGEVTWTNPTWEEVIAVSKYIVDNKNTLTYTYNGGKYSPSSDMKYPAYIDSESNFFITTSRQWGGDGYYTTVDDEGAGTVTAWNSVTEAAQSYFLNEAITNKTIQLPAAGGTASYGSSYMAVNKAYLSIGSTAGVKNNDSSAYFMKATTYPQKAGSENKAVIQQGTNLAILKKGSTPAQRLLGWLLIKHLTDTDNQVAFSSQTGYIPVRKSARNSEDFQALLAAADPSSIDYIFNGAVAKGLIAALAEEEYFFTDTPFNGSSIVRDAVGVAMQDMYLYNKSYATAMETFYNTCAKSRITCKKGA